MPEEPPVVAFNPPGSTPKTEAPARAWFPDDQGYQGEPIEYGGQLFYAQQVSRADLKAFAREMQRLQRVGKEIEKQQANEIKALTEGEDLSDERLDYFDAESEKIMDALEAAYNTLLAKGIVGWNLPRPFSVEALASFSKADKVALCEAIGSRSASGIETIKNSPGRSNR